MYIELFDLILVLIATFMLGIITTFFFTFQTIVRITKHEGE